MPPRKRTITATRVTEEVTLTETAHGPLVPAETWARLTAPLQHYQVPVIITPAERAASDAYIDHIRAGHTEDQALLGEWHAKARAATFGPLHGWLRQDAPLELLP